MPFVGFIPGPSMEEWQEPWQNLPMALNASSQKWHMPLLLILHWPKQVTWSSMASMGKKYNLLQGWAGREDLERKDNKYFHNNAIGCSIFLDAVALQKEFFSFWGVFKAGGGGAGRCTAMLSSTLIMRIYWLYLYYHFGDLGRHWIWYMIAA